MSRGSIVVCTFLQQVEDIVEAARLVDWSKRVDGGELRPFP